MYRCFFQQGANRAKHIMILERWPVICGLVNNLVLGLCPQTWFVYCHKSLTLSYYYKSYLKRDMHHLCMPKHDIEGALFSVPNFFCSTFCFYLLIILTYFTLFSSQSTAVTPLSQQMVLLSHIKTQLRELRYLLDVIQCLSQSGGWQLCVGLMEGGLLTLLVLCVHVRGCGKMLYEL